MGILKKLTQMFSGAPSSEKRAFWLYVQCNRCQEKLQARVDLFNDLSPVYEESGTTYFCRKVIMGEAHCFQKIEVEMVFDATRSLASREITGGRFITAQEFTQRGS